MPVERTSAAPAMVSSHFFVRSRATGYNRRRFGAIASWQPGGSGDGALANTRRTAGPDDLAARRATSSHQDRPVR